ncbi:MAG: DUF3137 domain-containing protein [Synergistaceae bacterium]|nr:DUF3137 domain-containing protein [Synergistaceae bacterium]
MEVIFVLLLFFLQFIFPFLIVIGLIWFFFVGRRIYREKKSFDASKGDETAMAMEKIRIKARLIMVFGIPASIAATFLITYFSESAELGSVAFFICFFSVVVWSLTVKKRYNENFKENFVKVELSKVFDNLQYEPHGKFDAQSINSLDFFKTCDAVSGNDLITAEYKGIRFSQCDQSVLERYTVTVKDGKGRLRTEVRHRNVFKGRAMRFDFADKFRGRVQVVAKDFGGAKVKSSRGAWRTVETELAEFGKHFEVYALDQIDALAVLTPQMIEGIFFLRQALGVAVAFYFIENTMVVFMEIARDTFDTSSKRTLLEERELLKRDIGLVTGFLEVMYFRPQEGGLANGSAQRAAIDRAGAAASVAEAIGPSAAEKLVHQVKRAAGKTVGTTLSYLPIAVIVIALASVVYGFINLRDSIEYMIFAGIFIIIAALTRPVVSLILLALHLFFLSSNL